MPYFPAAPPAIHDVRLNRSIGVKDPAENDAAKIRPRTAVMVIVVLAGVVTVQGLHHEPTSPAQAPLIPWPGPGGSSLYRWQGYHRVRPMPISADKRRAGIPEFGFQDEDSIRLPRGNGSK